MSGSVVAFRPVHGRPRTPSANVQPANFGRYEVSGLLGQGAMGRVYLAYDPKLHRDVAVKAISKQFAKHVRARERFFREARAIASLKHSNIVEIFDYSGEDSAEVYLVMERLNGPDLYQLLDKRGPMPEPIAAAIVHELCLALEHAHECGIIHRDLKPENVLIEWSGRVVLTDFGLVKAFAAGNSLRTGSYGQTDVIGTPGFMAPEQARGERLGPHTDIFALGALHYNLLTNRLPYSGDTPASMLEAAISGRFIDPRQMRTDLSDTSCTLLRDCLSPLPKHRLQSMRVVRDRLVPIFRAAGITDTRDEIARFMRAPDAHTNDLRAREIRHLRERIKLATIDADDKHLHRLRDRLRILTSIRERPEDEPRRRRNASRWRVLGAAALAIVFGVALGGLVGLAFGHPTSGHRASRLYELVHGGP